MKFLRLELLNLASLDRPEGEIIDFEKGPLGECNIFSIVGPTGSGKSTILDAICLALFNRAPRYPRMRGDRNQNIVIYGDAVDTARIAPTDSRNILTRGKKQAYSKLTFIANNGITYRAEWSVTKKNVRYDNAVNSLFIINYKDGVATETEAVWSELGNIIGLDYDQFLRTVLIAQGSFAGFLNAREEERYILLEKLIGSGETYSLIAQGIAAHRKEAAEAYDRISAGIEAYAKDDLTPAQHDELTALIDRLEKKKEEVGRSIEAVKKKLSWYQDEAKLIDESSKASEALDLARKALADIDGVRARLTLHDTTADAVAMYREIGKAIDSRDRIEKDLKAYAEAISKLSKDIDEAGEKLGPLREASAKASAVYNERKPHINRARALNGEIDIARQLLKDKQKAEQEARQALDKATGDVAKNKKEISEANDLLVKYTEEKDNLRRQTDQRLAELDKAVETSANAYGESDAKLREQAPAKLQTAKSDADRDVVDLREAVRISSALDCLRTQKNETLHDIEHTKKRNEAIAVELPKLDVDGLEKELETLRKTHTLLTGKNLETLRHNLVDGEQCPLCGATQHPFADSTEFKAVSDEMSELIDTKSESLRQMRDLKDNLSKEQAANIATLKQLEARLSQIAKETEKLTSEQKEIASRHPQWPIADTNGLNQLMPETSKSAVDAAKALASYNKLAEDTDRLRKAYENAKEQRDDFKKQSDDKVKRVEDNFNKAETALKMHQARTATLLDNEKEKQQILQLATTALKDAREALDIKLKALREEIGDNDPDRLESRLLKDIEDADKNITRHNEATNELAKNLQGIKGKEEAARQNLDNTVDTLDKISLRLDDWLRNYNSAATSPISKDDIAALSAATDDWEAIRADIDNKSKAVTIASTTLDNIRQRLQTLQQSKPEVSKEELGERLADLQSWKSDDLDEAKVRMQAYKRAAEAMGGLRDKLQEARQNLKEWDMIAQAIGTEGKTLRKIAQIYTLRFLIIHANKEIRRFNTRYELVQVPQSLGIRVIDHNRADDIRDTTSLSGGETFIVSLGLALGLSALSSRNVSFDNLFIDEGFGTLDPDTLAVVIDSLASLQSSRGKKVCVISHTDVMSERITTQIRIIKNSNSGSSHIEIHTA